MAAASRRGRTAHAGSYAALEHWGSSGFANTDLDFSFWQNEGRIRRRYFEEQLNQASCLNLVTNPVVLWNTVYIKAVLDQLKAEGQHVDDADMAHLSPARYAHLNPYGKYRFNVDEEFHRKGLRPLRLPDSGLA